MGIQASDTFFRLEHQMPELLSEMRKDLKAYPLRREMSIRRRALIYEDTGTDLIYYEEDHPDLLNKFQILANHGLVTEVTNQRYRMLEDLARYLGA